MTRVPYRARVRNSVDPRVLQLKLRVRAPRGTTREQLIDAVELAAETGVLPTGWTIHWLDWHKGEEGSGRGDRYLNDDARKALRDFWLALTHSSTTIKVGLAE